MILKSPPEQDSKESYLGDGLYVSFDGFQIILRAPREEGDHWVGLDHYVFQSLLEYCDRVGLMKKAAS